MNAATIKLVEDYYTAFNVKKWDALTATLSEDVLHHVNEGGVRRGKSMFRQYLQKMESSYDEKIDDLVVMSNADGSRAAAEFVVRGRYISTDADLPEARKQSYELPAGAFFEVRNGKIVRVSVYYNLKAWIAQVS